MGALAGFKYRDIVRRLKQLGDMPEGKLRAILKQAGIEAESFLQKK